MNTTVTATTLSHQLSSVAHLRILDIILIPATILLSANSLLLGLHLDKFYLSLYALTHLRL